MDLDFITRKRKEVLKVLGSVKILELCDKHGVERRFPANAHMSRAALLRGWTKDVSKDVLEVLTIYLD